MADKSGSEAAPSLDDVYTKYGIEEQQRQPAQSEQQTAPVAKASNGEDAPLAREIAALKDGFAELRAENERLNKEAVKRQEKADLQGVLEKLGKRLEGVKSTHIKYALAERYETDPKFKTVWDGRSSNPDAFNAALDALAPTLAEEFAVRADPKIADDQRAFDNALQSADSGPTSDSDDETHKAMKMSSGEFDRYFRGLFNG